MERLQYLEYVYYDDAIYRIGVTIFHETNLQLT